MIGNCITLQGKCHEKVFEYFYFVSLFYFLQQTVYTTSKEMKRTFGRLPDTSLDSSFHGLTSYQTFSSYTMVFSS